MENHERYFVNTAPHYHHGTVDSVSSESTRLQLVPITPRRKLRIPSIFATTPGGTISSSKLTNSPGKLKIPSAFSDLKSLKTPCIYHDGEAVKSTIPAPIVDTIPKQYWTSRSEEDQSHETVKTSNPAVKSVLDTPCSTKQKRKIRKQRRNKLSAKQQLLAEIAALQKEIQEYSLLRDKSRRNKPAVAQIPHVPRPRALESAIAPIEIEASVENKNDDLEEVLLLLEGSTGSNDTDNAIALDDDDDAMKTSCSMKDQPSYANCVAMHQEGTIINAPPVDSGSIRSPQTRTKNLKKLRSFFRRRQHHQNDKKTSGLSMTDVLS